jgi:predicted Ser/Thr protein kinase
LSQSRLSGATEQEIIRWIESKALERLGYGYQGEIYLYQKDGERFVVKSASGGRLLRFLRARMLCNEFAAYQRLQGFAGSPRCYGLLNGKYLVLEYIAGISVRHAPISDPAHFFDSLFVFIRELHARGVAHADLKRKDNLLVVNGSRPYVVDFGMAIMRKEGFAPLNHFLFKLACQFDLNAWIKLKYRKRMSEISAADRAYYHRTIIETSLRETKRVYKRIKRKLLRQPRR